MNRSISLITMGMGNLKALKKTFDSFRTIVDEFVYADMLLFDDDRLVLHEYEKEYNLKVIKLPFDFIFKNGFSETLNIMADAASNDLVIYLNTSEVIDIDYGMKGIINNNPDCNAFYFTHHAENFRWFRCYDRRDLKWVGLIHEELHGGYKPYHKPIFMMKDEEKDMDNVFKAAVFNSHKECTYWNQLIKIADNPDAYPETNDGWKLFAKDTYQSMKDRLIEKGDMYKAIRDGDFKKYMDAVRLFPFENLEFKSSIGLEYQGDPMFLGKK